MAEPNPPARSPSYLACPADGTEPYQLPHDAPNRAIEGGGRPTPDPSRGLEAIVRAGKFHPPRSEPALAMITDRQYIAGLGLDDVIRQIRQRLDLYRLHMNGLTAEELSAREAAQSWFDPLNTWQRDPQFQAIMREIDQRRRGEQLACWRDLSRLRQSLPEWAQLYLTALRKTQILDDMPTDPYTPPGSGGGSSRGRGSGGDDA